MNTTESAKILAILTAAYPNAYKGMTKEEITGVVMVWTMQFADIPADIVLMALNKAISTCKFPPTISEIKSKLQSLHWEAYDELCIRGENSKINHLEYRRIYEATAAFKTHCAEPKLNEMLSCNTTQYFIE